MGTIAKFLFAPQDTHNMGISPSGSAGEIGTLELVVAKKFVRTVVARLS
jgi:hypothetical protein